MVKKLIFASNGRGVYLTNGSRRFFTAGDMEYASGHMFRKGSFVQRR
jgi:hypothetical protein